MRGLRTWTTGPAPGLYVVGSFATAGGIAASNVARWTGSAWTALGAGVGWAAFDALPYDDGTAALFVAGQFTTARGVPASGTPWNGAVWSALGAPGGNLLGGLAACDDGAGSGLYVCGNFDRRRIALLRHRRNLVGSGRRMDAGRSPGSAGVRRRHRTRALHGREFSSPPYRGIRRWNGAAWSALPCWGADGVVNAFASAELGGGPSFFAGGVFSMIGGIARRRVRTLRNGRWSALGSGVSGHDYHGSRAGTFDHGNGPGLAGGTFSRREGLRPDSIARWNGSSWSTSSGGVMSGVPLSWSPPVSQVRVRAMTVFDDGNGSAA